MLIKIYSSKENIRLWQEFLSSRGHDAKPDSLWGPKTSVATRNFQTIAGLPNDGIVGDATLAKAMVAGFKGFVGGGTSKPQPTGKTILVSAGHSTVPPRDSGATGNGFTESYLALELRDLVADKLRAKGVTVIEDGEDGENEPLKKAISLVKGTHAAVEFHWNAGPPSATGIEILARLEDKKLAQALAAAIGTATGLVLRGDKGWKAENSGQHARLGFIRAGGLICEVAFISNKADMVAYRTNIDQVVSNLAAALAN